jgi:hypothetical protein
VFPVGFSWAAFVAFIRTLQPESCFSSAARFVSLAHARLVNKAGGQKAGRISLSAERSGLAGMSANYPLFLFFTTGLLWALMAWQSSRLLRAFKERFPQIAQREIPQVSDNWRHPAKALFFYRRRAVEILRKDPALWRERRRLIILTVLSVLVPVLGVAAIFIHAFALSPR